MTTEKKGCLAFAVCGSFCTLENALGAAQALTAQGWTGAAAYSLGTAS